MVSKFSTRVIGASVQGKHHRETGRESQDAVATLRQMDFSIICVADGHGAEVHCRSGVGAQLAVEAAMNNLKTLLYSTNLLKNLPRNDWERQLFRSIITEWNDSVMMDIAQHPFTDEENRLRRGLAPRVAYGTTLLAAVMTERLAFYLRIGDGNIVVMDCRGKMVDVLENHSLKPNETESMCDDDAISKFKSTIYISDQPFRAKAVFLTTDGVLNSFWREEGLDMNSDLPSSKDQFYSWLSSIYYDCLSFRGDTLRHEVESQLAERSAQGFGDDVSVATIVAIDDDWSVDDVPDIPQTPGVKPEK